MIRTTKTILSAACLFAAILTASAQEGYEGIRGTVRDPRGQPVAGVRVVFEPLQGAHTFLSQPSSPDGQYVVSLPRGGDFMVVAVISATGQRSELAGQRPFKAEPGTTRDLVVDVEKQLKTNYVTLTGVLRDPAGEPLEGYRVVLRQSGTTDIVIGTSSDAAGAYSASLKNVAAYDPVAIIAPAGRRIELSEDRVQASGDVTRDFEVPAPLGTRPVPPAAFPGIDRLFQNFIEDAAIVEHWRLEADFENASAGRSDVNVLRALGAAQFKALPQLELGARVGIADADTPGPINGGNGLTDLELWAKLQLGPQSDGTVWAPGIKVVLPVGSETPGIGADSLGVKLFAAARQRVPHGVISYNAAVEVTQDGRVGTVPLEGTVAPSAGIAYIYAPQRQFTVVGELFFGLERFENFGPDIRVSAGVNWKVPDLFTVRGALVGGLTDGAPDHRLIVGLSFDY